MMRLEGSRMIQIAVGNLHLAVSLHFAADAGWPVELLGDSALFLPDYLNTIQTWEFDSF